MRAARLAGAEFERWLSGSEVITPTVVQTGAERPEAAIAQAADAVGSKTLDNLFRLFLADPAKQRSRKTEMHYENLRAMLFELWGRDRTLLSIDREACRDLLEVLRWLPSNQTKRFPKLTAIQAATLAKERGLATTLTAASVNGYMVKLRTLFNFAVNEGWMDRSPARGLRVLDPVRRRDKRLPFSTEQLRLIFNAPLYTGCTDDWFGYANGKPISPKAAGLNVYDDETSCALIYSSKVLPGDKPAQALFGITDDEILRAREEEDILQFVMRGAIRRPDFDGDYDIYLYSKRQAELVEVKLLASGIGTSVTLVPEPDAGIMDANPQPMKAIREAISAEKKAETQAAYKDREAQRKKSKRAEIAKAEGREPSANNGRGGRPKGRKDKAPRRSRAKDASD